MGWIWWLQCFVSPDNAHKLVSMVRDNKNLNLHTVNSRGEELRVNIGEGGATALTWGVFPCREIQQPTIFDHNTFLVWAEEAFSLWTSMWLNLYEMESDSCNLIETI
jgi:methylenetetrahydrofolate reductase (NADPH)